LAEAYPVYVIDDEQFVRDWAELMCEDLGFSCRTFSGGKAFLDAYYTLAPGCILLDMRMPKPNGLAVQAELAARGGLMPVIAMTGYGDVDVAVQSMRLGAIEFLEKPFTQEVLKEAIEKGLRQLRQSQES
jgi:two-component system response regulator FixJ